MTYLERMVRRARVKIKMVGDGRVYRPPTNRTTDMIVDAMGVRFSFVSPAYASQSAIVRSIGNDTIDNELELERGELC